MPSGLHEIHEIAAGAHRLGPADRAEQIEVAPARRAEDAHARTARVGDDEGIAFEIGRAFAQVLAGLRGKPAAELRIGLGRDMRLTAPKMSAAVLEGLLAEGATVLDAGMVATEMLYHLVGSRELDGGAMVTASHNPKAYTGAKLVEKGALALSGERGIKEIQELATGTALDREPEGVTPGEVTEEEVQELSDTADAFIASSTPLTGITKVCGCTA